MQVKARLGDVIDIILRDGAHHAAAQVIHRGPWSVTLAVTDRLFDAAPDPSVMGDLTNSQPALVAVTVDVWIAEGRWPIIGRRAIPVNSLVPIYKVYVSRLNRWFVQDIDGQIVGEATSDDVTRLRTPRDFTPAAVVDAISAHFGLAPWNDLFDDLRPAWILGARTLLDPRGEK